MNKAPDLKPPDPPGLLQRKTINAKEFLAAFRERPDDFYLMDKFTITPKHLKRIYTALMEKGMLSEYEYNQREGKALELEVQERPQLSASAAANLIEEPSETLTERILSSGYSLDSGFTKALSEAVEDKKRRVRRDAQPKNATKDAKDLCPNCHKPKDPSSPRECVYCGVVFKKVESQKRSQGVWTDD